MIDVPPNVRCYYTVKLQGDAMLELISKFFSKNTDLFIFAGVVSADMASDIEATNEVETAVSTMSKKAWKESRLFNPLYLPTSRDELAEQVELDNNGDLIGIGSFESPYDTYYMEKTEPETNTSVVARVTYHQFQIAHPLDLSQPYQQRYVS